MKRPILTAITALSLACACQGPELVPESVVEIPEGAVLLEDTQLGMYYGDLDYSGAGVFSIVLSDARCYQDKIDSPYIDSEGDMVVLKLRTAPLPADAAIEIPAGEYPVSDTLSLNTISASDSYVQRLVGASQSKWSLKSGSISVSRDETGEYDIKTKDLVIFKGDQIDTVEYVCFSKIQITDYLTAAPSLITTTDDIVNMPFPRLDCVYNGDLYGNGAGCFVVNLSTKGFLAKNDEGVDEITDIPGVYITLSFFSRLYASSSTPILEAGRYTVSTATSESLFQRWSILPGLMMETTPFGSYVLQQPLEGEGTMEFISGGYVDVSYEVVPSADGKSSTQLAVLTYSFSTSSRKITGVWKGEIKVDNQGGGSNDSYLTTLDHDVECDMSKVAGGTLRLIEILHRDNVKPEWDYDIAEAWQLYLQPRDWNEAEENIPWIDPDKVENWQNYVPEGSEKPTDADFYMYDKNENGIRDRLEVWCGDGDVMILEFVLPLGSGGVIAPELNKEYKYTLQPSLAIDDSMYEVYVSRMGRPYDEIFDAAYAKQNPGWASFLEGYDHCNARRGFTWSEDGWRGTWYQHNETGKHLVMDEFAPAINGWVKVKRTAEETYDFEWEFIDDLPGTPNKITGNIKNCTVKIQK